MITLDDAIEYERKQIEMYKFEYDGECTFYGTKFVDEHSGNFDCIKKIHEHEQFLDWLEELKMYKEVGTVERYKSVIECYNEEYTMRKSNKQYNKAIDDFVKLAKEHNFKYGNTDITNCVMGFIEFFAKQLKESNIK